MKQLTVQDEIARRDAQRGMDLALDNVEKVIPKWGDTAYRFILEYAKKHERFAGWMIVKSAALDPNFPQPANEKAWGGPIQKAARNKVIERIGTAKDPHRHGNYIPLWRSTLFGEAAA